MNKLALIGTVAASKSFFELDFSLENGIESISQIWGNQDVSYNKSAEYSNEAQECAPGEALSLITYERKMLYSIWNGVVKGVYGLEEPNPIDQQCLGDWMEDDFFAIENLAMIFMFQGSVGPDGLPYKEAVGGAIKMVDIWYNANYQCQYEKIMRDMISQGFEKYSGKCPF